MPHNSALDLHGELYFAGSYCTFERVAVTPTTYKGINCLQMVIRIKN